jgi:ABC-type Fe3+/spermidine/putrescine transport system ATPase subunit
VITEKVEEVIHLVGLKGFEDRPAPMLSGGQQQRVALARALVYDPSLLLLDEPFSNLDAKLREKMRFEIKLLQEKLGLTILLVTHDYLDAFSLSDRIGVLYNGKFEQIDDVKQIYEKPRTPFVRDFIGKTVLIDGVVKAVENRICKVELSNKSIIELNLDEDTSFQTGEPVTVCIRPDDISTVTDIATPNSIPFHIKTSIFLGERYECLVQMDEHTQFVFYLPRMSNPRPNENIQLYFNPALLSVWRHENA